MRGKMDYRTKRNIIIAVIAIALFVIASVGTYMYLRGNSETEAVSELNSATQNLNASQEQAGETENAQDNEQQPSSEPTTTEEVADNTSEETTEPEQTTTTEETTDVEETATVATTNTNVPATQTPATTTQVQAIETTETVEEVVTQNVEVPTEEETTIVGFTPEEFNFGLSQLTANLPGDTTPEDTTAPVYKTLGIWNDTHYNSGEDVTVATTTEAIRLRIDFEEKLATEPKVKILGTDLELDCTFRPQSSSDTNFVYMADFKITEDMNLPEGEIQFEISGYADEVGNVGTTLTNADINWARFPKVVYDKTAPEYSAMGIFNWTNENIDHEDVSVATANEHIRLFVAFPEMLAVNPKVDIYGEDGTVTTMDLAYSEGAEFYFVEFDTTEDLKLPQGKIQYKIYGYADAAGNVGRDLTDEDTTDSRYLEVVYDTTAPEKTLLGILNVSHYNNGDVTVAGTGDTVRVYVTFNEKLATEPKVRILGENGEVIKEVECPYSDLTSASNPNTYLANFKITEDMNLPEGEIKFEVYGYADAAGNEGTTLANKDINYQAYPRVVYDKTGPKAIKVQLWDKENGETETIRNGQTVRVMVTFDEELGTLPTLTIGDQKVTMKPVSDGKGGTIYQADITIPEDEATIPEGRLPFVISGYADIVGNPGENITEKSENVTGIIYDRTAPVPTNLGIARNKDEGDTRDQHYAKEGDSVRVLISFDEELGTEPTVKFAGKEYTATYRPLSSNPESNLYYYMADIPMTADMPEGEMQIEVYGYADKAGNVGEKLDNTNITDTRYDKVIYDITAPYSGTKDVAHPLYILNVSDANRRQWIRNGEMLRVEANFNEDLDTSKNPILTIGTDSNVQTAEFEYKDTVDGKRKYVADIVINNNILNLADGTQIPFTVTNAFDKAGNEAVLNNEDVTFTSEYGQVTYDNTAPKYNALGIVNATHYDSKEGDIHYAKTDDEIRILVQFDEKLSVEPRIRILGENNEVVKDLNCGWASQTSANLNTNAYTGQFKITDDMNLPEGEIRFEIYGYADAAGNVGEVLDNDDLKYEGEPAIDDGVIYDKTVPVYTNLGIVRNIDEGDTRDKSYAKEGDSVRVLISFAEKLEVEPTVKFAGKEYTATYRPDSSNPESNSYYYMADIPMTADMPEGEMQFEVYGYADKAGNIGEKLDNSKITDTRYPKVIYDMTAPYSGTKDAAHPLYILNVSDANRRQWIRNGEMLRVEANFNEDLDTSKNPILTIGTDSNVQTAEFEYKDTVDGKRKYVADIVINNNILNLADGTQIPFTVTNAFDKAGNEAVLNNEDVTFTSEYGQVTYDNTAPIITTTPDSIGNKDENGNEYYSRVGFTVTDNYGVASYLLNDETEVITNGDANYETIKPYLKDGKNVIEAIDKAGNKATYEFYYSATPATRLATNILKYGESNEVPDGKYSVKPGDKIYMYIAFDDKLAQNPTFTLINNGKEYIMDNSLVKVTGPKGENNRYDYSVIYEIPANTEFVDGEITLTVSNIKDIYGYEIADETKPTNGHRVFFDTTLPTVELNGDQTITLQAGIDQYEEQYATVNDNIDGFISDKYEPTIINYYADPNSNTVTKSHLSEVNMKEPGLYKIGYVYTDRAGNKKQATRFVYVQDTTLPTITLNGDQKITIEAGTNYVDAGAVVTDNVDETKEIKYTNINYYVNGELIKSHLEQEDIKEPGVYKVGFEYTDKAGNTKVVVREVTVVDSTKPIVTLNGDRTINLTLGEAYNEKELGAIVTDNVEVDYSRLSVVINYYAPGATTPTKSRLDNVDTSRAGTYKISYKYVDPSGNESDTETRVVTITAQE